MCRSAKTVNRSEEICLPPPLLLLPPLQVTAVGAAADSGLTELQTCTCSIELRLSALISARDYDHTGPLVDVFQTFQLIFVNKEIIFLDNSHGSDQ